MVGNRISSTFVNNFWDLFQLILYQRDHVSRDLWIVDFEEVYFQVKNPRGFIQFIGDSKLF